MPTGVTAGVSNQGSIGIRPAAVKVWSHWQLIVLVLVGVAMGPDVTAGAGTELVPAARLLFPYYDVRPGIATILLLTNVSETPVTARLTFYDQTCLTTGSTVSLTPKGIATLDLTRLFGDGATEAFTQGFVDVEAAQNSLVGVASILNLMEDWAVSYHAASSRRLHGAVPFEPFSSRLALSGFFAQVGGPRRLDGLLILVAPHPTVSGGSVAPDAVQASFDVVSAFGRGISLGASGHQLILPLQFLTGRLPPDDDFAWVTITNAALDEADKPLGLVGLFIETLVDPAGGGGMAGALRLWSLR